MHIGAVVDILKVGLSGLVFLLAYLSYRMLQKEQEKPKADPRIIKVIQFFMWQALASALLVAGLNLAGLVTRSHGAECTDSLSRLATAGDLQGVTASDLRQAIQVYVDACRTGDGAQ
jgi:hypothetical protein